MKKYEVEYDKERLVALRKSKRLTQAKAADKLGISTRLYSDYENPNVETSVTEYMLCKMAYLLNRPIHHLWNDIPAKATVFYIQANLDRWVKTLCEGGFYDLKLFGSPEKTGLREPLLKLIDAYESRDTFNDDEKLSIRMKRIFECEDSVRLLSGEQNIEGVDGEKFHTGPARFAWTAVPNLHCLPIAVEHPETFEDIRHTEYSWGYKRYACIDFDYTDFDTKPLTFDYVTGWRKVLPTFGMEDLDGVDADSDEFKKAIEQFNNEKKAALDARFTPSFEDFEEPVDLSPEDIVTGNPEVGQLEVTINSTEKVEKKEKKKKDGKM